MLRWRLRMIAGAYVICVVGYACVRTESVGAPRYRGRDGTTTHEDLEHAMFRKMIALAAFSLFSLMAACDGPSPTAPINLEIDPDAAVSPTDVYNPSRSQRGDRQL